MKLLVMQIVMECCILKTKLMKKFILIILLFMTTFSFSQRWESSGQMNSDVYLPRIKQSETFFYTDYEFMVNEKHKTLSEIEAENKANKNDAIKLTILKTNSNSGKVQKYVKGNIYSEKTYKNNVLNGLTTFYYPDGTVFQEIDFANAKINGLYKIYNNTRDNQVILETTYKNSIRNGKRKYFIPREEEVLEGNYVNGNLVGDLKFTTENGYYLLPNDLKKGKVQGFYNNKLMSEFNIINQGDIHGDALIYFIDSDKVAIKIPYYLGEKNGFVSVYNKDGKEIEKFEYKNNKKVGDYFSYTKDNQISNEEHYDEFGNKTGTWREYKNGLIYIEQNYKDDKLNGSYKYYKNGKLQNFEEYKNGLRNGKSENYNPENGQILSENVYEKDVAVKSIVYYKNLEIFSIYGKDPKTNLYATKFFDTAGKLIHQNNYNDNRQPIGIHKNYTIRNEEPNSNSETHYDNTGKQTKHIYRYGNTSTETNYRNGMQHGEKIIIDNDNTTRIEYYYQSKTGSKKVTKEEFENLVKAEKK